MLLLLLFFFFGDGEDYAKRRKLKSQIMKT